MRQLAMAHFVKNLARLGVTIIVSLTSLQTAKHIQRAAGEVRVDQHRLKAGHQTVATKQGKKPRQTGSRDGHLVIDARIRQSKRSHIVDRLMEETIKLLVAGADLKHGLPPIGPQLRRMRGRGAEDAVQGCREASPAVGRLVQEAAMPRLASGKLHLEAEPAIGIAGLRAAIERAH